MESHCCIGEEIEAFSLVKRQPPAGDLVFDKKLDTPLEVSEDGMEVSHKGTNGAIYCVHPIKKGKWKWTVDILSAKGHSVHEHQVNPNYAFCACCC